MLTALPNTTCNDSRSRSSATRSSNPNGMAGGGSTGSFGSSAMRMPLAASACWTCPSVTSAPHRAAIAATRAGLTHTAVATTPVTCRLSRVRASGPSAAVMAVPAGW